MEVTIGSLDHPERVPVIQNFGVERRLPSVADLAPGRLPDKTTEAIASATRDLRSRQHPDFDTAPDWRPPA